MFLSYKCLSADYQTFLSVCKNATHVVVVFFLTSSSTIQQLSGWPDYLIWWWQAALNCLIYNNLSKQAALKHVSNCPHTCSETADVSLSGTLFSWFTVEFLKSHSRTDVLNEMVKNPQYFIKLDKENQMLSRVSIDTYVHLVTLQDEVN